MNHFHYLGGVLHAEDVPLPSLAEAVGTPAYVYSRATLERHYRVFADGFAEAGLDALVCYAMKANDNLAVVKTLADLGAGADVVSEGELRRALAAGVPPERIVFSGVGKTRAELAYALAQDILQINVESEAELEALSRTARALGRTARIAIRVNPDVDARTHEKISTGKAENKFGIAIDRARALYASAQAMAGIEPVSIAVHIGSQLTDLAPFAAAFARVADLARALIGEGIALRRLDLGGGLGVPYRPDDPDPPSPAAYAAMVKDAVGPLGLKLMLEPGRVLVANAGILLARVTYVKEGPTRRFVILDAAMNDLLRPALYDGYHDFLTVAQPAPGAQRAPADIVGPVCETGDTFARGRMVGPVVAGDLVAFMTAGAYGSVMASTYNTRPRPVEVMVSGADHSVIRPRQSYEDLIGADRLAPWQEPGDAGARRNRAAMGD